MSLSTAFNDDVPARYDRDGYLIFKDVLDRQLIQEASDHVDWLLQKNPNLRGEQLHHNLMTHDPLRYFRSSPTDLTDPRWRYLVSRFTAA